MVHDAQAPNWVKSCTACEPGTYTPRAGAERCENRSLHTTQDVEVMVTDAAAVTDEDTVQLCINSITCSHLLHQ